MLLLPVGLCVTSHLDVADLHVCRPISSLSFVSKILERVIDSRLTQHVNPLYILSSFQSAYRKCHSTETALVKVHNDLISAIDHGYLGALVTLDFSSTFDTVDHQTFLSLLQQRFGVADSARNWFNSYPSGRAHTVHLPSGVSDTVAVHCGVPQGSSLRPKIFNTYY